MSPRTPAVVHLVSSDSDGGRQARHYADHIAVVRRGFDVPPGRPVEVRHSEARNHHHLRELLAAPANLTVFAGHSGRDRIGSEDHGWAWLGAGEGGDEVGVAPFRSNGLILDTCGTGPDRVQFQPSADSKLAYLRCVGGALNRDAALVAFVLGAVTAGNTPALDSARKLHRVFEMALASWAGLAATRNVNLRARGDREWRTSLVEPAPRTPGPPE